MEKYDVETMGTLAGIYLLVNNITNEKYVGKTRVGFRERFQEHKRSSKSRKYPLYQAVEKYGWDNFSFYVLEVIDKTIYDDAFFRQREKYWIEHFYCTTLQHGYNTATDNTGNKTLSNEQVEKIISLLKYSSLSAMDIAEKMNVSSAIVNCIKLGKRHKRQYEHYPIWRPAEKKELKRLLRILNDSKTMPQNEVCKKYHINIRVVRRYIRGKLPVKYAFVAKYYSFPLQTIKTRIGKRKYSWPRSPQRCCQCQNPLPTGTRKFCSVECKEKYIEQTRRQRLERLYGISYDTLKNMIRTQSFLSIGAAYGVSGGSIVQWCEKYRLPTKKIDIKNYTDEEWEKEAWHDNGGYVKTPQHIATEEEIIEAYQRIGTVVGVEKELHCDSKRVRKVLANAGFDTAHPKLHCTSHGA